MKHPEVQRRRLLFRCWHSGTQEVDLIFGSFADARLGGFDGAQLDQFEALLNCPEPELFDWVAGRVQPPPAHDHDVMLQLRAFTDGQRKA